jgi:hypothetical protein
MVLLIFMSDYSKLNFTLKQEYKNEILQNLIGQVQGFVGHFF